MQKLLGIAIIVASLTACNESQTDNSSIGSPNSSNHENQAPATAYKPENGDMTIKDGKLMIMKNGEWKEADNEVKLENGAIIYTDGRIKKDDKEITLQDGEIVNEEGDVFDRTGNAIKSAWKDTKEGIKDAGNEIEKGVKKAGDKVEDVVDDDDKK